MEISVGNLKSSHSKLSSTYALGYELLKTGSRITPDIAIRRHQYTFINIFADVAVSDVCKSYGEKRSKEKLFG
ncbi:Hypothetical predicted protein [Octopus vulgaris]|uniref:Uncharacterized protein n=1 Tax=Octopus vulgaris TaxID=6645 RepID=A0AA36BN68_OCTVU|nr:Hypothetical predicted protein [Octopus vulgaris]